MYTGSERDVILFFVFLPLGGGTTATGATTNHNHTITAVSTITSNFKRQNTIDSASIKENSGRLSSRPVKNTANLTNVPATPLDSSKPMIVTLLVTLLSLEKRFNVL